MNNSIYDNWKEYDMDNQLNTTVCTGCKDTMDPMQSYQCFDNKTMEKAYICSICRIDTPNYYKGRFEKYPVKGLHFGDNS